MLKSTVGCCCCCGCGSGCPLGPVVVDVAGVACGFNEMIPGSLTVLKKVSKSRHSWRICSGILFNDPTPIEFKNGEWFGWIGVDML